MKTVYIKPNLFTMQQNINVVEDNKEIQTFSTTLKELPESLFAIEDLKEVVFLGGNAPFLKHIISDLKKEEFNKYSLNKINFRIEGE